MKTTNPHPAAPRPVLTAEPTEVPAGLQQELPDPDGPVTVVTSDRRFEALEHAWELGEERFTAAECSAMSIQQLHQLCDEAFAALDADFPVWGARAEYEVLCAELATRAQAFTNRTTSAPD